MSLGLQPLDSGAPRRRPLRPSRLPPGSREFGALRELLGKFRHLAWQLKLQVSDFVPAVGFRGPHREINHHRHMTRQPPSHIIESWSHYCVLEGRAKHQVTQFLPRKTLNPKPTKDCLRVHLQASSCAVMLGNLHTSHHFRYIL